jgi:hypothetical protein
VWFIDAVNYALFNGQCIIIICGNHLHVPDVALPLLLWLVFVEIVEHI